MMATTVFHFLLPFTIFLCFCGENVFILPVYGSIPLCPNIEIKLLILRYCSNLKDCAFISSGSGSEVSSWSESYSPFHRMNSSTGILSSSRSFLMSDSGCSFSGSGWPKTIYSPSSMEHSRSSLAKKQSSLSGIIASRSNWSIIMYYTAILLFSCNL